MNHNHDVQRQLLRKWQATFSQNKFNIVTYSKERSLENIGCYETIRNLQQQFSHVTHVTTTVNFILAETVSRILLK